MKNKRMFVAKYLGPTNYRGTRFKITDTRHRGINRIFSWDYSLGYLTEQATTVLESLGITVTGYSEPWSEENKTYIFTDDFKTTLWGTKWKKKWNMTVVKIVAWFIPCFSILNIINQIAKRLKMNKYKYQRIKSKNGGIRHRMIYLMGDQGFIKSSRGFIPVIWQNKDIWVMA